MERPNRFLSSYVSGLDLTTPLAKAQQWMAHNTTSLMRLGGGIPDPDVLPLSDITLNFADGSGSVAINPATSKVAQMYGPPSGYPGLLKQLEAMVKKFHAPPSMDQRAVVVTCGSQNSISLLFRIFIEPGDCIFVEKYTYAGALLLARSTEAKVMNIDTDDEGMVPAALQAALDQHSEARTKLIYLIPCGSNPEGKWMCESRRRAIYSIASKYDLLILEDDPYFFLRFIEETPPSFLALDTEQRVIRLDSLAKILSAGLRVGCVTIPAVFKAIFVGLLFQDCLHVSLLAQVVLSEILREWGEEGWMKHTQKIAQKYRDRRDHALKMADKYLKGLCEWNVPKGGMYLWVKVVGVPDTRGLVEGRCSSRGLHIDFGSTFVPDHTATPYVRIAYTPASCDEMEQGIRTLADCIREELKGLAQESG